jgi:uncharacterized membrane-anchored protein
MDAMEQTVDNLVTNLRLCKAKIMDGFMVVAEDIRHDATGATKDQIADHELRITRLEADQSRAA